MRLLARAAEALAIAFESLTTRFRPEIITVGGGAPAQLPGPVDEAIMRRRCASASIESARLGNDAGVIGAALLAMKRVIPPTAYQGYGAPAPPA